jgi:hypothetical protein
MGKWRNEFVVREDRLYIIRKCWNIQDPRKCLSRIIRPSAPVYWNPGLMYQLARLAMVTPGEHRIVERELLSAVRWRLSRYPESDPTIIVNDVCRVFEKHVAMDKKKLLEVAGEAYLAGNPKSDKWWMMREGGWGYLRDKKRRKEKREQQDSTSAPAKRGDTEPNQPALRKTDASRATCERYVNETS